MAITLPESALVRTVRSIRQTFDRASQLRDLEARTHRLEQYLATQHKITRIIAGESELSSALPRILQAICETADWDFGEVWHVNRQDNHLYCEATWCRPSLQFPEFEKSGYSITFAQGKGLPGRAWASGKATWVTDVIADKNFMRAMIAERDGLHAGIAIPIRTEGEIIGALTFFSRKLRPVDRELMQVLDTAGNQIGLYIERKRAEEAQQEKARLLAAMEERQRLARDLHDSVTQTLFSASVVAEMLPLLWSRDPEQIKPGLEELNQLTRDALTEMRSLLCELRSPTPTTSELGELLKILADKLTHRTNIEVTLDIRLPVPPTADLQMTLYRITQEALNNIAKHAAATHVWVRLTGDAGQITLQIEDNGCGFDLAQIPVDHFGLAIMRERAEAAGAVLYINSAPGKGTQLGVRTRPATLITAASTAMAAA